MSKTHNTAKIAGHMQLLPTEGEYTTDNYGRPKERVTRLDCSLSLTVHRIGIDIHCYPFMHRGQIEVEKAAYVLFLVRLTFFA